MRRPLHARRGDRRRLPARATAALSVGVVVLAAAATTIVLVGRGGDRLRAVVITTTAASTTTSTVAPTTTATTTSPLPPAGDASQPQTDVQPTAGTPAFNAEMAALWSGITSDQPSAAMPAFFPEAAYAQVKTYGNDNADWTDRLVAHYQLDIAAAHDELGAGAAGAVLTRVIVPTSGVGWIPPGVCDNRVGYWHVGGARLVYREGGDERSFGIASMISWRGYWYVVHLGSVTPPAGQGVVASPSAGAGHAGGYAGC